MNNVTLAHIGTELVVIGGIAFYFHRKTNLLQTELEALKKENLSLVETLNDMQDNLQQLGNLVMRLQQQIQNPFQHQQTNTRKKPSSNNVQLPPLSQTNKHPTVVSEPPKRTGLHRRRVRKHSDDSASETYDDTELDRELEVEYDKLNKERNKNKEEPRIVECDGDVCELPNN
jgi:hypothetical protein